MSRLIALAAACLVAALAWAVAQDDRFAFMPAGGAQLVERALTSCDDCGDLERWSAAERSEEEWREFLQEGGALEELTEQEIATLTLYLATAFPMDPPVADPADLPLDGRTLVIFQCQACHSIATPLGEDREVEYWLQHRTRPPHDGFDLDEKEWTHIAHYLAHNAPIPASEIPAELREGAGGY